MTPRTSGRVKRPRSVILCCTLLPLLAAAAAPDAAPIPDATVEELLRQDLTGDPRREALMLTVKYRPGGSSLPHRHDAQVFVYVLEGEVVMQVEGSAPVRLRAGQTFYEGVTDVHRVSANASRTAPAKMLVFMIKDKGKPVSRTLTGAVTP